MKKFESELGPDLLDAVARLGLSVVNFSEISRKPGGPAGRACFRLQLENGQILKGRHYGSAERCREVLSLYGHLEGLPFSKVLASSGQASVEQWIEGTKRPDQRQGERLVRWVATVGWWEWDEGRGDWRRVTLAEELHELIKDSKKGG